MPVVSPLLFLPHLFGPGLHRYCKTSDDVRILCPDQGASQTSTSAVPACFPSIGHPRPEKQNNCPLLLPRLYSKRRKVPRSADKYSAELDNFSLLPRSRLLS